MDDLKEQYRHFDIKECRAEEIFNTGLVDCLTPQQAIFCGNSQAFAYGYFCKHPCKEDFLLKPKK